MRNRARAAGAAIIVGALVLSGCTAAGDDKAAESDLDSLSIMSAYFSATAPEENDPIQKALSDLTGVDIEMRWAPNADYQAQTNVVLASDDIPDVIVVQGKSQGFVQTAEAGGFWDLTKYIESGEYPNLVAYDDQVQEAASVNGKIYGVMRKRDLIRYVLILRQDWLDNLGLEAPTTTEELKEVARAFTEDDPDGNGVDDTFGMFNGSWSGIGQSTPLDAIEVWFGAGNVWREEEGELIPVWYTDEFKEALDYSREFFENGWMEPDFPTADNTKTNEKFFAGQTGILVGVSSWFNDLYKLAKEIDPATADGLMTIEGQPEGPNGTYALPSAGYSGFLAISKAKVKTEADLKKVLEVLDTMASEKGQRLLVNGIEGENYEEVDGYAKYLDSGADLTTSVQQAWFQVNTAANGVTSLPALPSSDYDAEIQESIKSFAERDLENAVFNPAAGLVSPTYITKGAQLDQIISDARMQYIVGAIDEAGLDAAIENWKASGGEQVIAEYNELYKAND